MRIPSCGRPLPSNAFFLTWWRWSFRRDISPSEKSRMKKLPRSWVTVESGSKSLSASYQLPPQQPGIKVLQWNVLADGLAQHGNFVQVPSAVLEWEKRWPLILTEIQEADADLICLQEVNKYDDFFLPAMSEAGYGSFYLRKQKSPAVKYGAPSDGCVIFYRTSRFELNASPIGHPTAHVGSPVSGMELLGKRYFNEDGSSMNQGFIIMSLIDKSQDRSFILATTHLKAKNGTGSVEARNIQVTQLLEEINQFQSEDQSSTEVPVIVCGDFNDEPDSMSCQLMRQNTPFRFLSVWDFKVEAKEEPSPITTFKYRPEGVAKRIIDYIWFTSQGELELVRRWLTLSAAQIGDQGLPMDSYGSDHIALCAHFEWKPQTD